MITRGHFLSPLSEDVVLSMDGCEARAGRFRGSILLTRESGQWVQRWYQSGMVTDKCHKVSLPTGREILVCLSYDLNAGLSASTISSVDLVARKESAFFLNIDTQGNCGGFGPGDHQIDVGSIETSNFGLRLKAPTSFPSQALRAASR